MTLPSFTGEAGRKAHRALLLLHGLPSLIRMFRTPALPAFRSLSPGSARLPGFDTPTDGRNKIPRTRSSLRRDHESLHRSARAIALHALHAGLWRSRRLSHGIGASGSIEAQNRSDAVSQTKVWGRIGRRGGPFGPIAAANESALRANLFVGWPQRGRATSEATPTWNAMTRISGQ